MKVFVAFFLLSLFASHVVFAELKTDFTINQSLSTVKEGDLVEATLKVWPVENADLKEFESLQNATLFNTFQLINLQAVEPSANNADVIEVKGTYLVHFSKETPAFEFNYRGQRVYVSPPEIKVTPLEKKSKDYFVLDQSYNLASYTVWIVLLIFVMLATIAVLKRQKLLQFVARYRKDPVRESIRYFNQKFLQASKREDYEEIYAKKSEWLVLLKERPPVYNEFFKVINQHQYKPHWTQEDLQEVKQIFDIIRGSFK